jgi:hypothetical protein
MFLAPAPPERLARQEPPDRVPQVSQLASVAVAALAVAGGSGSAPARRPAEFRPVRKRQ